MADNQLGAARRELRSALAFVRRRQPEQAACELLPAFLALDAARRHAARLAGRRARRAGYRLDAPSRAGDNIRAALKALDADDVVAALHATARAIGGLLQQVRPEMFANLA